jgi:hypothetical protein
MSFLRVSRNTDLTQAERMIKLVPLGMIIPNWEGVYSYSRLRWPKLVTETEWLTYTPPEIKVGTPSDWRYVTAYSKGLSCYYIAVEA